MHVEFLLEEPSAEETLKTILPKILSNDVTFDFLVFEGKDDLLNNLPARLNGYRWIPDDWRIMVLIDEDRRDCRELKAELERTAREAGFVTKSSALPNSDFQVVNRLAIEELEAWFFGDIEALYAAYPRISRNLHNIRQNTEILMLFIGGTSEALERLLIEKNYYTPKERLRKPEIAQNIAHHTWNLIETNQKVFRCLLKDSKHA